MLPPVPLPLAPRVLLQAATNGRHDRTSNAAALNIALLIRIMVIPPYCSTLASNFTVAKEEFIINGKIKLN